MSLTPIETAEKWVSVNDRLPKQYEHVLVFFGAGRRPVREGYISSMAYNNATELYDLPLFVDATQQWDGDHGSPDEVQVTHWMPMPNPPVYRD